MGARFAGSCLVDANEAASMAFSHTLPVLAPSGELQVLEQVLSQWQVNTYNGTTLVSSVAAPVPSFAPCDVAESAKDGAVVGLGVTAVLAVGFWVRALRDAGRL